MAEKYKNFQSQTELKAKEEESAKARQLILAQAKRKYEAAKAKKEKARKQGEGIWMLDSVSQRVSNEEKEMERSQRKKKKKKKKKKDKKSKLKQYSSGLSSNDDEEEKPIHKTNLDTGLDRVVKGPQLQRDGWMEAPLDLIPTTSRQDIRDAVKRQKADVEREAARKLEPGQHTRELNPFWKDGGTGLPDETERKKHQSSSSVISGAGDGGVSWLRKAYERCKQKAQEEGRTLEDVAAERWESLQKLESLLAEAEMMQRGHSSRGHSVNERKEDPDKKWDNDYRDKERENDRNEKRSRGRDMVIRRAKSRDRETYFRCKDSYKRGRRDRSKERQGDIDKEKWGTRAVHKSEFNSRNKKPYDIRDRKSCFERPGSESDDEIGSSQLGFVRPAHNEVTCKRLGSFMKPSNDKDTDSFIDRRAYSSKDSMKPWESAKVRDRDERKDPDRNIPRWKKTMTSEIQGSQKEDNRERTKGEGKGIEMEKITCLREQSSSCSENNESSCSSSESDKDEEQRMICQSASKILSEEELNDLAAKILRAELMGDDDIAADLKSQLEVARQQREALKSHGGQTAPDFSRRRENECRKGGWKKGSPDEEENVVVLSRTSKRGFVRPALDSANEDLAAGGKKKKKMAATHDIRGERTIYFQDDDNFDLKTLVEQEKAGTAEDQNSMFARLAGRSTDRDLDVDDLFVNKAAMKQNQEKLSIKDRAAAIFEHKRTSAAMEKCHRCFEKIPKHLIIAIGTKSYLCLPHHRSLTEGHCLIVPMQHISAGTNMDEDVWQEMQLFRKSLAQMFATDDQDMVVMETVMHLKHFPHTAIECVPLDRELGDLAPIYFKKAIQEAGPEWADNKKLHSLKDKDIRHVIPKGFPYFSVDFGLQGGYATVIEDEASFPPYFGREIVGGMLDAEPMLWRKPQNQNFEAQRQKVLEFEKKWMPYDWTGTLNPTD